jgi:hypothetical protein
MVRGPDVEMSDIRRNIEKYNFGVINSRMRGVCEFVKWNTEGWKVGHCVTPPLHSKHSLLTLANNSAISNTFQDLLSRFSVLYKRKVLRSSSKPYFQAHLHHYTNYLKDASIFDEAVENVKGVIDDYLRLEKAQPPPLERLTPLG